MKRILLLSAAILLATTFSTCTSPLPEEEKSGTEVTGPGSSEDPGNPSGGETEDPENITLALSPSSVFVPTEGGQQSVWVDTNASSWTAQCEQPWCHIAKDGSMLNLSFDANTDGKVRTASVSVKAGKVGLERMVTVVQSAGKTGFYIYPSRAIVRVPSNGSYGVSMEGISEMTLRVQTNLTDWTCCSSEKWCEVRCDARNLYMYVYSHSSTKERQASVTFMHEGLEYSQITVIQNPWTSLQLAFPDGEALPIGGGSIRVKVYTNEDSWSAAATSADCWFTLEKTDKETLVLSAPKRTGSTPRPGKAVTVTAGEHTESFIISESPSFNEGYGYDDNQTEWDD